VRSRQFGGSGLGLSISQRLVTMMGGTISVTSQPEIGSTFSFELPVELAPADAQAVEPAAARLLASSLAAATIDVGRAPRVLVAEDVAMNQALMRALLKRHGAIVDVADNGEVAMLLSERTTYDLIFMDCQMPVLDGFDATEAIRARERAQAGEGTAPRVPIIAVTANALEGDRERCLAAGMDDYVSKPVRPADLARVLQQWCPATHADRGS